MGWILGALVVLGVLVVLALLVPPIFGVALAGVAPILVVVALIGFGGVWWRHAHAPVEPEPKGDQPDASDEDERP